MRTTLSFLLLLAACGPRAPQPQTEPAKPGAERAAPIGSALLQPNSNVEKAPEKYKARFQTTKGDFVVEVTRAWAPNGADRFYNLVKRGYYDGIPFFRVMSGFMAQTGIHSDPSVSAAWREARIPDDPVKQSNTRGMVTFAMGGPNTRSSHIFINYANNSALDSDGFSPFGRVVEGMENVEKLYAGYGDKGVDQYRANMEGARYFNQFDKLDYIKSARLE